jgi:membrane protease subunit (stomatin/prohibitin family)
MRGKIFGLPLADIITHHFSMANRHLSGRRFHIGIATKRIAGMAMLKGMQTGPMQMNGILGMQQCKLASETKQQTQPRAEKAIYCIVAKTSRSR